MCCPNQVAAYDTVVAILNSSWLRELCSRMVSVERPSHHFRVFFDDIGCYEVIVSEFRVPWRNGP